MSARVAVDPVWGPEWVPELLIIAWTEDSQVLYSRLDVLGISEHEAACASCFISPSDRQGRSQGAESVSEIPAMIRCLASFVRQTRRSVASSSAKQIRAPLFRNPKV